jgi:hypothetical protein
MAIQLSGQVASYGYSTVGPSGQLWLFNCRAKWPAMATELSGQVASYAYNGQTIDQHMPFVLSDQVASYAFQSVRTSGQLRLLN